MAALSDPRAFLSAQEKRAQQMKAMGIEETDINTKDIVAGGGGEGEKTGKKGSKNKKSDEPKKGKIKKIKTFKINQQHNLVLFRGRTKI